MPVSRPSKPKGPSPKLQKNQSKTNPSNENVTAKTTTPALPESQPSSSVRVSSARARAKPNEPTEKLSNFEQQIKLQMEELRNQQKQAEDIREKDKKKQNQSLKEKLKMRSSGKKTKKPEPTKSPSGKRGPSLMALAKSAGTLESQPPPQPKVPVTTKETLYAEENTELFNDLESFALTKETTTTADLTFVKLMKNLLIDQLSDLEKVRILFHWITAQDLNSMNYSGKILEDSPLELFKMIKQEQKTYASMFARLCGEAGIHAKVITGFLKGAGYFPDYKFGELSDPFRGSWNAVLIDGQWRLIDTNWGSRHVTEEGESRSDSGKPEYKYEEHYFLTDPDLMINTHFPDEPDWQLLPKPYTLEQFEKLPKFWPLYYKLKLELISHKEGVIYAKDTGYLKIQFKVSAFARTDSKLRGELRPRTKLGAAAVTDLAQCLFHHTAPETETFEIFLPEAGKYVLKIYALSNKYNEKNTYTNLCIFQVNCSIIKKNPPSDCIALPPFPVVNLYYGPSVMNSHYIARPVSHPGPVVDTNNKGEAKVVMAVVSEDPNLTFTHDLYHSDAPKKPIGQRVIQSFDLSGDQLQITFHLRTPGKGNYALILYSNVEDTSTSTFHPFCYYLVVSSAQKETRKDFPEVPNDVVGALYPRFSDLSLKVNTCCPNTSDWKSGMLNTNKDEECMIVFEHSHPITMLVDFTCPNVPHNLNSYTSVESTGLLTCVIVRTPTKDFGKVPYIIRIYGAESADAHNIPSIYVGVIFPSSESTSIEALPQSPSRSWGPSGAHYAKTGITWLSFENSTWFFKDKCNVSQLHACGPHRVYEGGSDFQLVVKSLGPLQMKTKLLSLKTESDTLDNFTLLSSADTKMAVIHIRITHPGYYSLVLYGCKLDDSSGHLAPLVYIAINAKNPSDNVLPYPTAFGVWASSARQLFSPLQLNLERNKEVTVKAYLAKFKKNEPSGEWEIEPYSSVMFVIDGTQPLQPKSSQDNTTFEWAYYPGPGEKLAGILVKTDDGTQSMAYALQFQIH